MKWETIDKAQIDDLMAGNEPRPPQDIDNLPNNKQNFTQQDNVDTKPIKTNIDKNKPAGQV